MTDREVESQHRLRQIADMAMGVYLECEPKRSDTWREIPYGKLWSHFTHEVEEIRKSRDRNRQLHNILDAINLLEMLASKIVTGEK